jgi:hypothetical protein
MNLHTSRNLNRLYRTQLPPPPKNWDELIKHPHIAGFIGTTKSEYGDLDIRHTFNHLSIGDVPDQAIILPLI